MNFQAWAGLFLAFWACYCIGQLRLRVQKLEETLRQNGIKPR